MRSTHAATIFGLRRFAERSSDDVIHVVSDRLGTPTSDTGFVPPGDPFACEGDGASRIVRWGDLRMTFAFDVSAVGETTGTGDHLAAWSVGDEWAEQLSPDDDRSGPVVATGITTAEGIGVGSMRADVAAAYPDGALVGGGERMYVLSTGTEPADPVGFAFDGDRLIGIVNGPLDCLDLEENR